MNRYFDLSAKVAESVHGTFLQFLLPALTIIGSALFFYFGYKGIVKRETISLYRFKGRSVAQSAGTFTGFSAVIVGILYIITGILVLATLSGVSVILVSSIFS